MYDVAIIGTGAAGISAAITLQSRGKGVVLIGRKDLSKKMALAEQIRNYPGAGIVSGEKLAEDFANHLAEMNIGITDKHVTEISRAGDSFNILCGNENLAAYSVLLAVGVANSKAYPGENELLGKGVSYCATCDGFLYQDMPIAVVCLSKEFEAEIDYLASVAKDVYLVALYKDNKNFGENVHLISGKDLKIIGTDRVEAIEADGKEIKVNAAFIMRDSIAPATLIKGLEMDGNHIKVDRNCATNIKGCYAAGDCTGRPYQYVKAAGEGNVAAHSILDYLAENGLKATAKTRPYKKYPLSFMDAIEVTDTSGLPTEKEIKDIVRYKLTEGEVSFIEKEKAENGDVITFDVCGGQGRFNKKDLRLTLGQYLYDFDVEKALVGACKGDILKINNLIVTVKEICKAVNVEPTDEMVKALGIEGVETIDQYTKMVKDETETNEIYLIFHNVFTELLAQEPPFSSDEATIKRLGELEIDFFNDLFAKQVGTPLLEMTAEQVKANLGVDSVEDFIKTRREWYVMKHQQVLLFSRVLGIELKGQYDYMNNYEALGLLQQEAIERLKKVLLKKEEA